MKTVKLELAQDLWLPLDAVSRAGGFSEPLGRLNTLGLVESPARGEVRAAPALFLERSR